MFFIKTLISFLEDAEYRSLMLTTVIILAMGTLTYRYLEGWGWIDALYFSVVTLTTIGYGDITPQTDAGKLFTIFYIFTGIGIILTFVNTVYEHYADLRSKSKNANDN